MAAVRALDVLVDAALKIVTLERRVACAERRAPPRAARERVACSLNTALLRRLLARAKAVLVAGVGERRFDDDDANVNADAAATAADDDGPPCGTTNHASARDARAQEGDGRRQRLSVGRQGGDGALRRA